MGICLGRGADLHMAQLMPLPPTVFCFSKIQIGFTFLVPARPGSSGKGPLNGCFIVIVIDFSVSFFVCLNCYESLLSHTLPKMSSCIINYNSEGTVKPRLFCIKLQPCNLPSIYNVSFFLASRYCAKVTFFTFTCNKLN